VIRQAGRVVEDGRMEDGGWIEEGRLEDQKIKTRGLERAEVVQRERGLGRPKTK
jgi:hypothetical protein